MDRALAVTKALSDRNRVRIVMALRDYEELCACQLTALLEVSGATASRHLGQLVQAGLLESRKAGRWVYYRLAPPNGAAAVLDWLAGELRGSEDLARDVVSLTAIMARDPEDICREQRGETCCPSMEGCS